MQRLQMGFGVPLYQNVVRGALENSPIVYAQTIRAA